MVAARDDGNDMANTDSAPPDTRSRILAAALELFFEHGFDGTSLQQIADRLGLTKAALYYHFRSKDELLGALVGPAVTELEQILDVHAGAPDTPALRRRFLEDFVDHLLAHRQLVAYVSRDLAALSRRSIAVGNRDRRRRVELMLLGQDRDSADEVRLAMAFGGIHAAIAEHLDVDAAQLRPSLLDAAARLLGIRRPPSRRSRPTRPPQPT